MYIPNNVEQNYPSVVYNKWLNRLDNQLNEPTNQNSIKVPTVVKPTNKKMILQNFGDQCNKQPNVPLSLCRCQYNVGTKV